jgi:hypothetical protein
VGEDSSPAHGDDLLAAFAELICRDSSELAPALLGRFEAKSTT